MSDGNSEFRADIRTVVKRHDPSPSALRALAEDMQSLAQRFEEVDETL